MENVTTDFTISSSDGEILKALGLADDIAKEFKLSSVPWRDKNSEKSDLNSCANSNGVESGISLGSEMLEDGIFSNITSESSEIYESLKHDPEMEAVKNDIETINIMIDLSLGRMQAIEIENTAYFTDHLNSSKEILTVPIFRERIKKIATTLAHILKIHDQAPHLKQILQDNPLKNSLKVSPSCQKEVINFFLLADNVMEKFQQDVESYASGGNLQPNKVASTDEKELLLRIRDILAKLAKRIDIITEFRDELSHTKLLSSIQEQSQSVDFNSKISELVSTTNHE